MKKLYLIIFSLLLSTNSYAEYYFLMKNLDSQFYMDMSSIKKLNNGHIRVWEYINFLKQKDSIRSFNEYDCNEQKYTILQTTTFRSMDLKGDVVENHDDKKGEWHFIPPNSPAHNSLDIVCLKK